MFSQAVMVPELWHSLEKPKTNWLVPLGCPSMGQVLPTSSFSFKIALVLGAFYISDPVLEPAY
jgi:hypothetical protein